MDTLYQNTCLECSKLITNRYSTSFSLGIRLFNNSLRNPIYAIYGFVRFADEIVDTFHQHDKTELLERFRLETFQAIEEGISLNPVLQAFQSVVNTYSIPKDYIEAFLKSMAMDLEDKTYNAHLYDEYIYGSAEVVGLMCLKVFLKDEDIAFEQQKSAARKLGAAFQKVNFLRDMRSDFEERGRVYFPGVDYGQFSHEQKIQIEEEIKSDFDAAYEGIKALPKGARLGVYMAYIYYQNLFMKIKRSSVGKVKAERIRVKDSKKAYLLAKTALKWQLRLI